MSSPSTGFTLAIRRQRPALERARHTQTLTKGEVKSHENPSASRRGALNPLATRPGLYAPAGRQPFISKGLIMNPDSKVPDKLSKQKMAQHTKASTHSFAVSFSGIKNKKSKAYAYQLNYLKREDKAKGLKVRSFLTTTNVNAMQANPNPSGDETELFAQGHKHVNDQSMMQHFIRKSSGNKPYSVRSSHWMPSRKAWGPQGEAARFKSLNEAFHHMYLRGVKGTTS